MVVRSLFTGVSGLQSHFSKMDTLSNNISNVNTSGFKKSNVVFKSFLAQQTATATSPGANRGGTNPQSVGLGTQVGSVNIDMSQGQLERTGVNTDVALQGDGFFTTREAGTNSNLFTRAGSFEFDSQGKLVAPGNGNIVQGFNAEVENGEVQELVAQGQPEDIQVTSDMESIPGQETTFQEVVGNLDADADTSIDPVTVDYGSGDNQAQVRFKFERYHPTKNQYRFSAEWTENPPSGKQIGDTVTDQVTGREFEGILELNDEGQVTGLFRNPDTNNNNGIEQVEVGRNPGTGYTINEEALSVRDQAGLFNDLTGQNWNGEMRLQFRNDSGDYRVQWQNGNTDEWNDLLTDPGAVVNEGGVANDDEIVLTSGASEFSPGDTIRIEDDDGDAELAQVDSISGSTLELTGPLTNDYESAENPVITRSFSGNISNNEELVRDVVDSPTMDNIRNGELKIDSDFVSGTDSTEGDEVFFSIAQADNTGMLNQSGEEVKEEFRWGGKEGRFRVSSPEASAENSSVASLDRVFNYDESNIADIGNSTHLNDIPNKEFNILSSGGGTYHVGAETANSGVKGAQTGLTADETAGTGLDANIDVADTSDFAAGDLIRIQDSSTGQQEALVVREVVDGTTLNVEKPGGGGSLVNDYNAASTNISNYGQILTNQNGSTSFTTGSDQKIFLDQDPTEGDSVADAGERSDADTEIGVSIAAGNWTANPDQGDEFNFTVTEARSQNSNRGFGVVQSGSGQNAAMFMPSGTESEPSSITFAPNQTDTSGILDQLSTTGSSATATQKDPETVQTVASSDVFDSLGGQHTLNYTFEKQSEGTWLWSAEDPTPVDPGEPELAGFGKLNFDENGQFQNAENFAPKTAETLPPPGPKGDLEESGIYFNPPEETLQSDPEASDPLNNDVGASPVNISPDFGSLTQFSGESNTEIGDQDGTAQGSLTDLSFDQTGVLQGSYDNGERRELAQLSIASFQNAEGLSKEGSTYFSESANSGIAQFGTAGSGGRGTITPGALERSNVELSAQFTQVIGTQRGFQANTRTITTSDQMVQSVLQLI